jgi:hypothetical protein
MLRPLFLLTITMTLIMSLPPHRLKDPEKHRGVNEAGEEEWNL